MAQNQRASLLISRRRRVKADTPSTLLATCKLLKTKRKLLWQPQCTKCGVLQNAQRRKPAAKAQTLSLAEQAYAAHQISLDEAFTLMKIEQLVKAQPDGKFAELLVVMLQGQPTDQLADAELMGLEVARG